MNLLWRHPAHFFQKVILRNVRSIVRSWTVLSWREWDSLALTARKKGQLYPKCQKSPKLRRKTRRVGYKCSIFATALRKSSPINPLGLVGDFLKSFPLAITLENTRSSIRIAVTAYPNSALNHYSETPSGPPVAKHLTVLWNYNMFLGISILRRLFRDRPLVKIFQWSSFNAFITSNFLKPPPVAPAPEPDY